ncbi:hypothetical protein K470DRAFT_258163 [Piedraia hortae CBS 480.64]|uniref:Uncharacterized protein n=1 Tax=Piedraia hortae CBS 480.64 TaxID=1314780 RepID=A0A6A7C0E6_9PEZI|nr:hypothetical protein K470DRAFT_258163 [Piedraia hortae CBS 480.64]
MHDAIYNYGVAMFMDCTNIPSPAATITLTFIFTSIPVQSDRFNSVGLFEYQVVTSHSTGILCHPISKLLLQEVLWTPM